MKHNHLLFLVAIMLEIPIFESQCYVSLIYWMMNVKFLVTLFDHPIDECYISRDPNWDSNGAFTCHRIIGGIAHLEVC